MNGTITTYLPQKHYGFIKGDDEKDYFFHRNSFTNASDHKRIFDGSRVSFEQTATPKGYQAVNCALVDAPNAKTYIVPDRIITSKESTVKGWDLVEVSDWIIASIASDDLDAARKDIVRKAEQVGATALIDFEYSKGTDSSGNYYYSVHSFRGRPAIVARRHAHGTHEESSLEGLNERLESAKEDCEKAEKENQQNVFWLLVVTLGLAGLAFIVHVFLSLAVVGGGLYISSQMSANTWLHRSHISGV